MSDPRRSKTKAWSIAGALAAFVLLSILVPIGFALFGAVRSAPFFGEAPSAADRAESANWLWFAFGVSAASVLVIVLLIVVNRRRGVVGLVIILVLAGATAGVWAVVAVGTQSASDSDKSTAPGAGAPSAAPTIARGRYIPNDQGTAAANALITRLEDSTFPADAGPAAVGRLVARAKAHNPQVQGVEGDVTVGMFVGDKTCVVGEVRDGHATWSVAGLSVDGGCLNPEHG